jgi:hypothetical protein
VVGRACILSMFSVSSGAVQLTSLPLNHLNPPSLCLLPCHVCSTLRECPSLQAPWTVPTPCLSSTAGPALQCLCQCAWAMSQWWKATTWWAPGGPMQVADESIGGQSINQSISFGPGHSSVLTAPLHIFFFAFVCRSACAVQRITKCSAAEHSVGTLHCLCSRTGREKVRANMYSTAPRRNAERP